LLQPGRLHCGKNRGKLVGLKKEKDGRRKLILAFSKKLFFEQGLNSAAGKKQDIPGLGKSFLLRA